MAIQYNNLVLVILVKIHRILPSPKLVKQLNGKRTIPCILIFTKLITWTTLLGGNVQCSEVQIIDSWIGGYKAYLNSVATVDSESLTVEVMFSDNIMTFEVWLDSIKF